MVQISPISSEELKQAVQGTVLRGNGEHTITEIGDPLDVGPGGVAFFISESYLKSISQTKASVLVVQSAFAERIADLIPETVHLCIECQDAYLGLANFTKKIQDTDDVSDWRLSDATSAAIHPTAKIDPNAQIGPGVIIGERAVIGTGSVVLGNVAIGPEVQIGSNCLIFPGVVLYPRTVVGNRVRIHANAVIGSDGFGYARGPHGSVKIWHLGKVVVGDDVEIGAGTTIDRGTIKDTIIEKGAKIDNLVQIGHNGHVKAHAIICAQVGLAGNVTIGHGAIMAGKSAVADKVAIGDGAVVGPMSGISKNVRPGEQMMGQQRARPVRDWRKLTVLFERLPELYDRVKRLEGGLGGDTPRAGP